MKWALCEVSRDSRNYVTCVWDMGAVAGSLGLVVHQTDLSWIGKNSLLNL